MWMQDKPLLQEELGRTISQLIHAFQTTETQHLFLQTFWQTMNREWPGIDRLRLDKYYMLMRMVLNESLKAVRMQGWEERQVKQLLELLTTEILHPNSQAPNGVKSHFLEIFLEELSKVGAQELTAEQNLRFIDPFCRIAARTKDPLVLHNITRGIFEKIVEQAPFAIEDLMNEVDTQEEEEEVSEGDDDSSGSGERGQGLPSSKWSKKPPAGSIRRTAPERDEAQADDDGDGAGPVLQFDYEAVGNRLFEMASRQNTPSQNRKRLYKVIRKLQNLAEGIFPEDDIPEEAYGSLHGGRPERRMKKRLSKSRLQKKGKIDEDASPDPSSETKRKRSRRRGAGAVPAVQLGRVEGVPPQGQPRGCGQRAARKRRRKPRQPAGARAKVADVQESEKKKWSLEGRK
ncbi:PREDICTED: ribosomal RNA processing protein 1 homolog A isoform X2 [Galeopterus variegatus]|uniref:Ribosomal RNA processing protein 1 homolog A isoform X2 n=2 Tax=Galeopterus variegatus TaxID=482537 RepID=A0ABM0S494_GALVR|nr:PREDICTED: ribosomal RNA processing protein 1 homolog A isoform X2 [Galeopterus variegatus]